MERAEAAGSSSSPGGADGAGAADDAGRGRGADGAARSGEAGGAATSISPDALVLDVQGIHAYLREAWPSRADAQAQSIRHLAPGHARLQVPATDADVRPGGSISGPSMMALADTSAFVLCLAHLGDAAMAVTSHLSMEFLRRGMGAALVADVRMEKLGRTQLTFSVRIHTPEMGEDKPCALSTVVYSRALLG